MCGLLSLSLDSNDIGDAGAAAIVRGVVHLPQLRKLECVVYQAVCVRGRSVCLHGGAGRRHGFALVSYVCVRDFVGAQLAAAWEATTSGTRVRLRLLCEPRCALQLGGAWMGSCTASGSPKRRKIARQAVLSRGMLKAGGGVAPGTVPVPVPSCPCERVLPSSQGHHVSVMGPFCASTFCSVCTRSRVCCAPTLLATAELCFVCRHVFVVALLAGSCRLASVRRGGARCGLRGWVRCPVRSPV